MNIIINIWKNCFMIVILKFDLTSRPWGEDRTPLIETLQAMVRTIELKTEMKGPTAEAFRALSLDERISKVKRPLDDRTK